MKQFFYALVRWLTRWAWFDVVAKAELKAKHYEQASLSLDVTLLNCLARFETIRDISAKGSPQRAHANYMVLQLGKLKQQ